MRLRGLSYRNIRFRTGDGVPGWPEEAPFDAVIVTAAPPALPPALVAQLKPGGRLIAPIGRAAGDDQMLIFVEKDATGAVRQRELCPVRFVPLISERRPQS